MLHELGAKIVLEMLIQKQKMSASAVRVLVRSFIHPEIFPQTMLALERFLLFSNEPHMIAFMARMDSCVPASGQRQQPEAFSPNRHGRREGTEGRAGKTVA